MGINKCGKTDCFANDGIRCKCLSEAITKKECPFYKTDLQLKEGRRKSIERLTDLGRVDLLQQYTQNTKGYVL